MIKLKIKEIYLQQIIKGVKTFEIRKEDNKIFKIGDILRLTSTSTKKHIDVEVIYTFRDNEFVKNGYVVLGIQKRGEILCSVNC